MIKAQDYKLRFVSFARIGEEMASSTLMPGQAAEDWQIEILENYLKNMKGNNNVTESQQTPQSEFI